MKPQLRRRGWVLGLAALLAAAYILLLGSLGTLTGSNRLDGSIGLLLGLYICSHPAGNFIDLIFYRSLIRDRFASGRALAGWVLANLLVLLVGWFVIFVGTTRFTLGLSGK